MASSGEPFLSIAIPTRNRAPFLRHALTTLLTQQFDDYEIVIADNASTDDTATVASETGDHRVRHVPVHDALPVVENWERAVSLARGEWVALLGDDDGLLPSTLPRLVEAIEAHPARAVAWSKAWYVHPVPGAAWRDPDQVNHLFVNACTGITEELDARVELRRFFERRERLTIPGVSNGAIHRDALDRLRKAAGRVFDLADPSAYAAAGLMGVEPTFLSIDLPLLVKGVSNASVSSGFQSTGCESHEVVREYQQQERLFSEVPLSSMTSANTIAEALLRAQRALPDQLADVELDPARYFVSCGLELRESRRHDRAALAEWRQALAEQPPGVRLTVWSELGRHRTRRAARGLVARFPRVHQALRRPRQGSPFRVVSGSDHGFTDLVGAARYLDRELSPLKVA